MKRERGFSVSDEKAIFPAEESTEPTRAPRRRRATSPQDHAAEIPRLTWPGRIFRHEQSHIGPANAERAGGSSDASPHASEPMLRILEHYGDARDGSHRLIQADALDVVAQLEREGLAGKIDLVYVDPPFLSQSDYILEARLDGNADGRVVRSVAYEDRWGKKDGGPGAYLDMLAPRLDALTRLLSPRGTIWVHLDWRAAYLVRVLLDEIMGRDAFMNEVVWKRAPNLGRQARSGQFGRTLDTLVVYGNHDAVLVPPLRKEPIEPGAIRTDEQGRLFTAAPRGDYTDESIAKLDQLGRVHRTASGKVYIKYFLVEDEEGRWCRERPVDTLWTDIAPLRHAAKEERTGYPTQKPRALLERVIVSATKPGALVLDVFAGSGTTAEAAHVTGRRAIVSDAQNGAISTARARFIRANMGFSVEALSPAPGTSDAAPNHDPPIDAPEEVVSPSHPHVVSVSVRRMLDGSREVTLLSPREPLSWAVGALDSDGVFSAHAAAARIPGKKAAASPSVLLVKAEGALHVRVHTDDGMTAASEIADNEPIADKKRAPRLESTP